MGRTEEGSEDVLPEDVAGVQTRCYLVPVQQVLKVTSSPFILTYIYLLVAYYYLLFWRLEN